MPLVGATVVLEECLCERVGGGRPSKVIVMAGLRVRTNWAFLGVEVKYFCSRRSASKVALGWMGVLTGIVSIPSEVSAEAGQPEGEKTIRWIIIVVVVPKV
jgi:hypothetical protein